MVLEVVEMYTVERATLILGVSDTTVRRWMKKCGIQGKVMLTGKRKIYLSFSEMVTLVGEVERKVEKSDRKRRPQMRESAEKREEDQAEQGEREKDFYSLANAASFLGVSTHSIRRWINKHNIAKKIISTDRKRSYIARADLLRLADLHGRKAAKRMHADVTVQSVESDTHDDIDNRLYSLSEAALYLNASKISVKRWIVEHGIEKIMKSTDRNRVYIAHKDMVMLAELHTRKVTTDIEPVNVAQELKEIRSKLRNLTAEVEALKHDFRAYIERSIYIG
jgi:predicted site-specific integrase-resolvase